MLGLGFGLLLCFACYREFSWHYWLLRVSYIVRGSVKTHLFPNNTLITSHSPSTHTKIMFGTNHLIIGYINASFTINRRHTGSDPNALTVPYANHNNDFHSWSLLTSFDYCHSCRWALCKWFDFGLVLEKRCDCNLVKARVLSHHEIEVGVWARVQFALSLCQPSVWTSGKPRHLQAAHTIWI